MAKKFVVYKRGKTYRKAPVRFKLMEEDGRVRLITVNKDGGHQWYVLGITDDGMIECDRFCMAEGLHYNYQQQIKMKRSYPFEQ